MNGLATQQRLEEALRYLRERGKYALDRPVTRRNVKPPVLTQHKIDMQQGRKAR